jgi:glyoxylate/hydroxypyruvate reductase A
VAGLIAFVSRQDRARVDRWLALLRAAMPGETIRAGPPHADWDGNAADIDIAIVGDPPAGALAALPGLAFIQSTWAGIDALLADRTIPPAIPLARLIDPALADDMAEYVMASLLWLHRQMPAYRHQQQRGEWLPRAQPAARDRRIGLLGMGEMGQAVARHARRFGFPVQGWSRSGRPVDDIVMTSGDEGLRATLATADILINLLPLTAQTRDILDAARLRTMRRGASLINVGRGGHVVLDDLVAALDSGDLDHAVLDVFAHEPLAAGDPLWHHPRITITPHIAATTTPATAAIVIAANIARFRRGERPAGLVTRTAGY